MECSRRQAMKGGAAIGIGLTLEQLLSKFNLGMGLLERAFAGNGSAEDDYKELQDDLYKDLASLMKWCESKKAYSEHKHLASLVTGLYEGDKEKCDAAKKILEFDMEYEEGGQSKLKDIPITSDRDRVSFAKAYTRIAKKYSKKFFDLGKKFERQKTSDPQEALKLVELKDKCMDAALALTPNDKRLKKNLKIEDISENGEYLESKHFKIKAGEDKKETTALLQAAEEYYDFFTQEFGQYMKLRDFQGKVELHYLTGEDYEKACGDKDFFKQMRSFADDKAVYMRRIDAKNDKELMKLWTPRSTEDSLREALFNLMSYRRINQPSSKPVHTDSNDKSLFSLVRGLSVFFSSKPEAISSSDAVKLYKMPETDKALHANFLRFYSKNAPTFEDPEKAISPEHDAAMWGRLNYSYFAEDMPKSRRDLNFVLTKWAFSGDLSAYKDHFQADDASETATYIKGKKR